MTFSQFPISATMKPWGFSVWAAPQKWWVAGSGAWLALLKKSFGCPPLTLQDNVCFPMQHDDFWLRVLQADNNHKIIQCRGWQLTRLSAKGCWYTASRSEKRNLNIYIYVYCIFIYIYIKGGRERERHTHTHTHTQDRNRERKGTWKCLWPQFNLIWSSFRLSRMTRGEPEGHTGQQGKSKWATPWKKKAKSGELIMVCSYVHVLVSLFEVFVQCKFTSSK